MHLTNARLFFLPRSYKNPTQKKNRNSLKKFKPNLAKQLVFNSIQFKKRYLKIKGPSKHVNNTTFFSDKYTKQHRFIGQTQAHTTYTFLQKHIHKHSYLTYTMYIQTCTFTDNNKHVEQERTVRLRMININIAI